MSKEDSIKVGYYNREGEKIDPPSEDYYDEGSGTLVDWIPPKIFNVAEAVELANGVLTKTLYGSVPTETAAKLATAVLVMADRLAMSKEEYKGPYIYHKLEDGEDPDVRFLIPTEEERKYGVIWHFDTYKDRYTWFKEKPPGEGAIWIPEIKPKEPSLELLEMSRKFKSS